MTTLHVNIPADLEMELSKLQIDVETVVIDALRLYVLGNVFTATDEDVEIASVTDIADEILTADERNYYLNL
ncbi:hypothetical protein [Dyadobacter sp. CY312]|uniref:hypothetical protein n=1 Tax=Dyadobacter sp. CY312 TaxID=2907303 RepID=UPI001F1A4D01|nr:hypothetical protein [Dyadobacter sp. CY312]MCE7039995.1 hypothetical protein [Dyadobacter sp. CY312]